MSERPASRFYAPGMDLIRQVEALGLFAALGGVAAAQAPLCEWSPNCMERTGWVISNVGDLDHDGLDDVAVAFPARQELQEWSNGVELFSAGRAVLRCIGAWGSTSMRDRDRYWSADRCGESLAVLRRDESGFEVAVGAPGNGAPPTEGGAVDVRAVLRGSEHLQAWRSPVPGAEFGAALVALPDLDADGRAELAIGAPGLGSVELVLTTDGLRAAVLASSLGSSRFGAALAVAKDSAQGWNDAELAVGAPLSSLSGAERGAVHVFALETGMLLRSLEGRIDSEQFGARLVASDLDGDSARELVVGSAGGERACAAITVVAAADLSHRWRYEFEGAAAELGLSLDVCGDLDGDGCSEVLAAFSPRAPQSSPEVVVLSGRGGSLLHAIRSIHPVRSATGREFLAQPIGLRLGSRLGVASAGDQNGDGVDDVWIATRSTRDEHDLRGFLSLLSGASLRSGTRVEPLALRSVGVTPLAPHTPAECVSLSIAELPKIWESSDGDGLSADDRGGVCVDSAYGRCVRTLGDLDGDGRDEVWAAGFGDVWSYQFSYVIESRAEATVSRLDAGDFYDALRVHDFTGDGVDDFVLGAAERTQRFCESLGVVRLYSGATRKLRRKIEHPGGHYTFATSLARVGDVDGDGVRDLAVSTPEPDGCAGGVRSSMERTGSVALIALGPGFEHAPFFRTLRGDATGADQFGRALGWGGDWDGDGVADLAVGAPADSLRAARGGAVHVYSGASWERLASFASDVPRAGFGREVVWARDFDGDGRPELIVAAPWSGEDQRGCVVAIGSRRGEVLWRRAGAREHDAFGASLVLGDLDGDGRDELVVGAPGAWREDNPHRASVVLLELATGRPLAAIEGEAFVPADFEQGIQWSSRLGPYSYYEPTLQRFGRSLAIARDLDGDDVADLVIGSPTYLGPEYAGSVYALSGAALMGEVTRHAAVLQGDPSDFVDAPRSEIGEMGKLWIHEAHNADYQKNSLTGCTESAFGRIVVWVGDQNSDGADDLVLGAKLSFIDEQVILADGRSGRELRAISDQLIHTVARLGSRDDAAPSGFAVGSGEMSGFFCSVYGRVRLVGTEGRAREVQAMRYGFGNSFAQSVVDAGDLDGDGVSDLAIGCPRDWEGVRLVSGASGSTLDKLMLAIDSFGATLAAGPDLDGDGVGELVIGAPGSTGFGRAVVYSGKTRERIASIEAPTDASLFAQTLSVVDDCDGDSVVDLVVGDPWWGSDSRGLVRLYSGRTFEPLRTWRGEHAGASLGRAFCADHDLDGDGVRDFVMGAPGFGRLGPRGAVYVISPTSGRILLRIDGEPRDPEYRFLDTAQMRDPREFPRSHSFGWAVATGDFNGDGLADLAIGSPQAGPHHLVGKVYAISGVELRKHMAR